MATRACHRLARDGEDWRARPGGAAHRGAVPAAVRRARCCRSSAIASCSWRCPSPSWRPAAASRRSGSWSPRSSCPSSSSRWPAGSSPTAATAAACSSPPTSRGWSCRASAACCSWPTPPARSCSGVLAALYGTADAFFQPAFTGLLPQTVSHAGQLQPANALRGLSFSVSNIAGPAIAGVLIAAIGAGRGDALRRRLLRGQRRLPAAAAPARWRSRGSRRRRPRSSPRSGPAGARCAAARGSSPAWGPCARTRASCCPPSTCSARSRSPSASAARAPGRPSWSPSAWAACWATCCCCASARRHALLTAGIALILASSQAAVYGAGVGAGGDVRAAVRGRDRRDRVLHALGGVAAGAHPGRGALARELVRLPGSHHPHARRHGGRRPARRVAGHAARRCWG